MEPGNQYLWQLDFIIFDIYLLNLQAYFIFFVSISSYRKFLELEHNCCDMQQLEYE